MNADLHALLHAIRDTPDDELPRLALADWCMEQPDAAMQARGEYIHASLRRVKLAHVAPESPMLDERLADLERRFRRSWYGALRHQAHRVGLDRGMLVVEVSPGSLSQKGSWETLARQRNWPWVVTVIGRSVSPSPLLRSLVEAEAMTTISRLEIHLTEDIHLLARASNLRGLRSLELRCSRLLDSGASLLGYSEHLTGLKSLGVFDTNLTAVGVAALATGSLVNLQGLNLGNNEVGTAGAESLAGSRTLSGLRRLWLHNARLGDEGACRLAQSTRLRNLLTLALGRNNFGDRGAMALAGWPGLASVRELDLSSNPIGERGTLALAASLYGGNLTTLDLDGAPIGDEAALALARLPSLQSLSINGARLSFGVFVQLNRLTRPVVHATPS